MKNLSTQEEQEAILRSIRALAQQEQAINLHNRLLMRIQLELGKICKETSDALTPEELIADINRAYREIPKS